MELILEVVSSEKHLLGDNASHCFLPAGGVIGRGTVCDWVIPDQTRHLSSRHGIISYQDGQYQVTDISTNGIYLNGSEPLPKNQAVPLTAGDRLMMGQIQLQVRLNLEPEQGQPVAKSMSDDVPAHKEPFSSPDIKAPPAAKKTNDSGESAPPGNVHSEPPVLDQVAQYPETQYSALRAFAGGLGVDIEDLMAAGGEGFLQQAGALLRLCLSGMVESSQARACLKNEFRLNMTLVNSEANNPIKLSANTKQAIKYLLKPESDAFLPMDRAIQECFQDFSQHQLATMAGMQNAFVELMDTLSPDALQKRFDRNQSGSFALGSRNARYWEFYRELHQDLMAEDNLFMDLFAEPFAKAYDAQIAKLKK